MKIKTEQRESLYQSFLGMVYQSPGITQREIAKSLGHHPTFIRKMANKAIEEGVIIRTFNQQDEREVAFMEA